MNVLVAGATGFVGQNLVPTLTQRGYRVTSIVRKYSMEGKGIESDPNHLIIPFDQISLSTLRKALRHVPVDTIVNLASYGVQPDHRDLDKLIEGNMGIVISLLKLGKEKRINQFIHMGSCFEYCAEKGHKFLREDDPLWPFSMYGAAKLSASVMGQFIAGEFNMPFCILRSFGVYGIGEAPERLLPYIIRKLSRDQDVDLTPGNQIRDFLNIKDVISGIIAALNCQELKDRVSYNLCSGRPVTIRKMCEMVAAQMGKPSHLLKWGQRSYRANEPLRLVGSNAAFRKRTGWFPQVSHEDGIREMIPYYIHKQYQGA